ncbi:MAG: Glucose-6-phosphate isomerase [Candidatus Peregrinibacteria bacterium GW2011_GWA2_43_8]|nr:MAG: Glucose-6-phosphate isomerase [Candidatus Peregrinibacteria bacterium GW2011_GWA2_43_8]
MQIRLSSQIAEISHSNLKENFLKEVSKGLHPFIDSALDKNLIKRLKTPKKNFKKIIILGIGGSALGGIAVMRALYRPLKHMEKDSTHFFFLDQIDPDLIFHLSENISLKDTHFIAISKSGNTIETVSLFKFFYKKILDAKLNPKDHFTIITAEKNGFLGKTNLPLITIPKNLSGRFSVLSEVGLLPAKIAKIEP